MAQVTYSSLKLKTNKDTKKIEGTDIEVLQYLPIEDKSDLITLALQNSKEDFIYNAAKLDAYFHLYIVMMYTNIKFTDKQKEEPLALYDTLKSNGIIDKVILAMDENEYNDLIDFLNQQEINNEKYKTSLAGIASTLIEQLPTRANQISELIDNFDPEKFQNLFKFAMAVNGGRPIQ